MSTLSSRTKTLSAFFSKVPSPGSSTPTNSSPRRTVEITIHRYTNESDDGTREAIKTKDYFVKVAIGSDKKETRICRGGNGPLVWNETFTFHNVDQASVTLGLYYNRTLRRTKLVGQFPVPLPEIDAQTEHPSTTRTATFLDGPQIQFSIATKEPGSLDVAKAANESPTILAKLPKLRFSAKIHDNDAKEAIKLAVQAMESQSTPTGPWKRVLEGIQHFRDITGVVAEAHPYAKHAYSLLFALPALLVEQLEHDKDARALLDSIANFCGVVNDAKNINYGEDSPLEDVLKRGSLQITEVAYFVRDHYKDGSFLKRAVRNQLSGADDTIKDYRARLDELKDEFLARLSLQTGENIAQTGGVVAQTEIKIVRVLEVVEDITQSIDLNDIAYVPGAGLNTEKMCLVGTRTEILDEITQWVSFGTSRVLLLSGGAGTGKSSIAHTIARRFKDQRRLGSMFCFSEAERATRKPTSLFPHIARDLADLDANIRAGLSVAAHNKADRTTFSILTQFETLILTPANAIRKHLHGPVVIVIDALDEAGAVEERRGLLQVLSSKLKELPPNFRIIITSRPDLDIQKALQSGPDLLTKRMHSISPESTANDITAYVRHHLAEDADVTSDMCQKLATHARGLFQWAKVACDYIRIRDAGETALDRYEELTRSLGTDDINGDTLLDYLYRAVLSRVLSSKRKVSMENFKFVMARVLTAFEPLSCKSLDELFAVSRIAPEGVKAANVIAYLGSLLSGADDQDCPIRPLHTSFRDFLKEPQRSGEFHVDLDTTPVHLDMATASLAVMKQLRFNICQLPTSHLANQDIPGIEGKVAKHIPPHLSYACRFWASHLCSLTNAVDGWDELAKEVRDMLCDRALYWLEGLSLLGASDVGLHQIRRVELWIKTKEDIDEELLVLMRDLELFWSYFARCIARSATHIYVSALPFAPKSSLLAAKYTKTGDKRLSIVAGQLEDYPSCLNILHGHDSTICSVAFSPDGTRLVSGSGDATLRVWNTENGDMVLGPLHGHTDYVNSVAFSPDGLRIASGSRDSMIRVWNAENGELLLGPLQGHTSTVFSVAFSSDNTRIVSGSADKTIRLWDAGNGDSLLGPLVGHTDWIYSVSFSPDNTRIVSGSGDNTISVWSTEDGKLILGPLQGHTSAVCSVGFSPDGTRLISGSADRTIRIWNADSGENVIQPIRGHTNTVRSVAMSSDGSRIISGSFDKTIRIWNTENGELISGPFEGHTNTIYSVAISPDGTRIISGSRDSTIRVWNTEHGKKTSGLSTGHTDSIDSIALSPDGTRIVSGSRDRTIRVWSAENGDLVLGPIQGHIHEVYSVAYSPNGAFIVSGSADRTIRVWNAQNGELVLGPLHGHNGTVFSVTFSPDDTRIVSGSSDNTIRIWSVEKGETVLGPLQGHTGTVFSVAFSPDGTRIASGSTDHTIRVWDARTGDLILGPLQGHTNSVRSVAFSPNGTRIVSASHDNTICIWNAETGDLVLGPLSGHANWVRAVAFSPDGSLIASGSSDRTIRIWNAESGETVIGPLQGHTGTVFSVAFSIDGQCIVSGSQDKNIRIQNLPNTVMQNGARASAPLVAPTLVDESDPDGMIEPDPDVPPSTTESILPQDSWRLEEGWSLGTNGELLFYVPPVHQPVLWGPRTLALMTSSSPTKLDTSDFVHGPRWTECFGSDTRS